MCTVSARIASNASVHGVRFAVEHEIKRAQRRGLSRHAAVTWAIELVAATLRACRA